MTAPHDSKVTNHVTMDFGQDPPDRLRGHLLTPGNKSMYSAAVRGRDSSRSGRNLRLRKAFIQSTDLDKPSSVFWAKERRPRDKVGSFSISPKANRNKHAPWGPGSLPEQQPGQTKQCDGSIAELVFVASVQGCLCKPNH